MLLGEALLRPAESTKWRRQAALRAHIAAAWWLPLRCAVAGCAQPRGFKCNVWQKVHCATALTDRGSLSSSGR